VDSDHSGAVSIEKFLPFVHALADSDPKAEDNRRYFKLVFDSCDVGRKGTLARDEFFKFMKWIGQPVGFFRRKEKFKKVDIDRNGTIDLDEIIQEMGENNAPIPLTEPPTD
jgi:Ca2+-binding EF-hand superfamily protein